jgi:hypothetical protein
MAKYKAGMLISTITGKLGSVVFAAGKVGGTIRMQTAKSRQETVARINQQTKLGEEWRIWRLQGDPNKAMWRKLATDYNKMYTRPGGIDYSAPALFMMFRARYYQGSAAFWPLHWEPSLVVPPGIGATSAIWATGKHWRVYLVYPASPSQRIVYVSHQIMSAQNWDRPISPKYYAVPQNTNATALDLGDDYPADTPDVQVGQRVRVWVYYIAPYCWYSEPQVFDVVVPY